MNQSVSNTPISNIEIYKMIEAYKLFYGELPSFSNKEDIANLQIKFQLMLSILSEYNMLDNRYKDYSEYLYNFLVSIPFSSTVYSDINVLISKLKNMEFQERLSKVDSLSFLPEIEKNAIIAISYLIKQQSIKENIDPIEFLKQLSNILYYRCLNVLCVNFDTGLNDRINEMAKNGEFDLSDLGYSKEIIKKRLNFSINKLDLLLQVGHVNRKLNGLLNNARQDGFNNTESYTGLLTDVNQGKKKVKR